MRARRVVLSVAIMNCLATTGTDPVLPFLIGALLICVGIVVAAVAVRRKRAGLALALVLLLGLGAGAGSLLDAPAPAQAACVSDPAGAPGGGGPGGGAPCVPATAIADVTANARAEWTAGDPAGSTDLPLDAASALAWQSALDAINALSAPTFANGAVAGTDATNSESVVITESGFTGASGEVPANAAYVHATDFDAATQGLINPTVVVSFDLQYSDGCGGTLTTHFTATGPFTNTVPCVPATKIADFAVGSGQWTAAVADPTITELVFTTAENTLWNTKIAAITAIDTHATKTGGVLSYGANTFNETPSYNPTEQGLLINTSSYQTVIGNGVGGGTMVATFEYDYADGCGGTLVTHVTATGTVAVIPV